MGYILKWADLPEPVAAAEAHFEVCPGPASRCSRCSEYFLLAKPYTWHLNVAAMEVFREGMRRAGMSYLAEPQQELPEWPFADLEDWQNADQERRDAYKKVARAAAAQGVPGKAGIPEFKLSNGPPWLLTVEEIKQALVLYDMSSPALRAEMESGRLWRDWIGWLRETKPRGGFTVS